MITLYSSPSSPFGRKVKVAALALGLNDRLQLSTVDTKNPQPDFLAVNPLGKIPALRLDNGECLYDSPVILEYLDWLAGGGKILPPPSPERFAALRLQAAADGIIDAGILRLYEYRYRPENMVVATWLERQEGKMVRSLDALEKEGVPAVRGLPDVGQITLAVAFGWMDFRFKGFWRQGRPGLVAWYDGFRAAMPEFDATAPRD